MNWMEWGDLIFNYFEIWWVILSVSLVLVLYSATAHLQIAADWPKA